MSYRITYPGRTLTQIRELDRQILRRIMDRIDQLEKDPRPLGYARLMGHSDLHRIRVGDYRIVYRIADAQQLVEIDIVAHRREVYRDL